MTKQQFLDLIKNGPIILDGATGTNLQKAGMPTGVCPEQWILDHKDVLLQLQKSYKEAGSKIVYAPTFSGNRIKLEEYGLEQEIKKINTELVKLSKEAMGEDGYVAGNITMTGEQLYPMGSLSFEELVDIYKEQAGYMIEAGVDLFVVETMMSLAETRAAVIAIKEICDLPVMVSMTYNEDGRTLYGTDPETAVVVLQSLGVDMIGTNCSTGPKEMVEILKKMRPYANVPLFAKPNAGLPELVDGETVYQMTPEEFASFGVELVKNGAAVVGGCCGTTPAHMKALYEAIKDMEVPEVNKEYKRALASERKTLDIDINGRFLVVGERINPTGKKKLQEQLREGNLELVLEMAESQEENGADILDINMGMNGIDEKEMMLKAMHEVARAVNLPLCIDSSHVDIIEAALREYPGRALINSISLESGKFEPLIPIAKKYGAMFVLLPLSDKGLPENLQEKKEIIHTILEEALRQGIRKEDIIVDGLVATIGANKNAALETFETIRYCKEELGLCTICGLSNISFGLPERSFVNSAFVTMAIQAGLTMAIANPSQELLMNSAFASDLLLNKEESDLRYINRMNGRKFEIGVTTKGKAEVKEEAKDKVFEVVVKGNKSNVLKEVDQELAKGTKPEDIINTMLIPAINHVGELFDQQIYFLPQLISSAETMKIAIEYLEPMIKREENKEEMATIVVATVEGDIHDIGKNLVVLMLKNYGYNVIDLGKDVPKEVIIEAAKKHNAKIIGLSALMTTTMMRMKDVVELARKEKLPAKIIIGGAVITQSFADEIGADGYSKDAADAVKLVQRLLKEE
ncbi:MAG: homocysteine S-methyltransferase family protein [Lachnospiraceae bacterium]|nr:homocysteine S-methyltransferase family protein [Lachnospiraceae bacterium]